MGYGGRLLKKSARVFTNDPKKKEMILTISGQVKKFVTVEPRTVRLQGKPGETLSSQVKIVREKDYPFTVKKVKTLKKGVLEHALEAWEKERQTGFNLKVSLRKKEPGLYRDALLLETDSDIQPVIRINVMANIAAESVKPSGQTKTADPAKQDFNQLIQRLREQQQNTPAPAGSSTQTPKKNPEEIRKLFQELIQKQARKPAE